MSAMPTVLCLFCFFFFLYYYYIIIDIIIIINIIIPLQENKGVITFFDQSKYMMTAKLSLKVFRFHVYYC